MNRNLVVIGGSAGGLEALRVILGGLPKDFPASICVVIHIAADSPNIMGDILRRAGPLDAVVIKTREALKPGTIYLPCPDHHLLLEPLRAVASRGPRENRFRPAIDPLFRSAASAYGPRVIGVVLSGGMDDGSAGLWAVKRLGGLAIVQDPQDALVRSMPQNAIHRVSPDHVLPAARIAAVLDRSVREDLVDSGGYVMPEPMKVEVKIANEASPLEAGVETLGAPSTYACPECHGVLLTVNEEAHVRFRCHTGHAYAPESLIAEMDHAIEESLGSSMRALQEKAILARDLADRCTDAGRARELRRRADEAQRKAELMRATIQDLDRPGAAAD